MRKLNGVWWACSQAAFALASGLVAITLDAPSWYPVDPGELMRMAGTTNPYASKYTRPPNSWACVRTCYNAGGHDFMCQDNTLTYTLGTTGSTYTVTTNTKCTPLWRYDSTITTCKSQDLTFSGDCDPSYDKMTDP